MQLPDIKQRLSISTVLKRYNLQPDRNQMLKCPFHQDKTPSLKIYNNTNTFYCFGCGATGDQVQFIEMFEKLTKHQAIETAKTLINPSYTKTPLKMEHPAEKEQLPRIAILSKVVQESKASFKRTEKAREYLRNRGLDPDKTEAGYIGTDFGKTWNKQLQESGLQLGILKESRQNTIVPKFRNCVLFFTKNEKGQVIDIYGRSIINNEKGKHFYLNGHHQGIYPHYPNPETTQLILTEAIIDAATLQQMPEITEEYSVLACYGTNGLTGEHKKAIKELQNLQEIIFFFDGDKAGTEAIKKYQEEFKNELPGIKLTAVETPENEDINSLSIAYDKDIFTHLLENRKSFLLAEKIPGAGELSGRVPEHEPVGAQAGRLNTKNPEYITFTTDSLQIIILGGINLQQLDRLRITVKISRTDTGDPLHSIRHTLDLYHSDYLEKFINKASEQLETGTNAIRRAIAELTEQIENYRLSKIESMKEQKPQARQLTEQRYRKAINYLKSPKLMERTNQDIGRTGMIGEENNRLLMYLVFTSRLREQPLHIISLGASGTGKTYLQERIAELIPEQDKLEITILSENAFYYFDRKELKHKLVLIEDMDGAENVLYPLRELQSKKKISKTIPIKDSKGNLRTITLHVEGPICLAGTTTREKLYEDNANRSLLIYLDNGQGHKEKIMEYQRKLSAGRINTREENQLKEFFKDMQTVLKPVKVRNPYAELLKLPEYVFKPLRTNAHYLATIETITFYHQYQRELKMDENGEPFIETTLEDIEWANKLLRDVLLAKSDELNQALRNFYETLKYHVKASGKGVFYSKEIREKLRMNPMTVNRYIRELENRNFIKRTGGNRKAGFEYEIANWEEYNQLQSNINALDEVLNTLKKKYNISITKPDVILKPSETPVN